MKLGIIHLSDIHFRKGSFNPKDDREIAKAISAAVRTELIGTTHVILVVSGDIAYAGDDEEFRYAADWFSDLYTLVADGCDATCWIICSPGNHDVDHSKNRSLRRALLNQVRQDSALSSDRDVIEECTKEQESFFLFRNDLEGNDILVHDDPLLRIHRIRDEESIIQVNVFNSAWMSPIDERPGSIVFPIEDYRERLQKPDGFSISVLHHPLGWFTTEHSRKLRTELTACSSVVLFGHEHIPDNTRLLTELGDHVRIVDGGVLRGTDSQDSSFNLLLLDTKACLIKVYTFEKTTNRYERTHEFDWQDATRLTSSESGRFRLRQDARARLEDVGSNILHPRHERLSLRDIFVYPDLMAINTDITTVRDNREFPVSAETLIFNSDISHVLLEGGESSGKSALLRMLFLEFYQRGKIPLYIQGSRMSSRNVEGIRTLMKRIFSNTYTGVDFTQFEQLDPAERVLLVDDFDFRSIDSEFREVFFEFLQKFAAKSVVVTRDIISLERYAATKKNPFVSPDIHTYLIQEFGHVKRDELIKRWILLGRQTRDWNTPPTLKERDHVRFVINTTLGRNLMPSFPIFLLVILQSTETAAPSTIGSTYGHYYQFLITRTLMESGVKPEDLDAFSNYVSELAFSQYFTPQRKEIPRADFRRWHESFCREFGVDWDADRISSRLESANILTVESTGTTFFKYQYVYYFFLAKRLANAISDEAIRDRVRHMCDRLHIDEYANIALFLIHHSNDKFVLDCIRRSAESLLHGQPKFALEVASENGLLNKVNRLPSPLGIQILEDRDPDLEQEKNLRERDFIEANHLDNEDDSSTDTELSEEPMNALDILAQAGVAAKTVELVGQVLRNYYGSLRIDTKVDLGQDAIDLALRALYSFFDLLVSDDFEIVDVLATAQREYEREHLKPSARRDEKELERWAREFAFSVLSVVARIIIRKVATALGSEQLKPTLEKVVPKDASLAYRMVEIAALLDGPTGIPRGKIESMVGNLKNNSLGFQVLRDLTAQRVYRYPTEYKDKQWLAEKLNFSMVKQRSADLDKSRRLLPR